MDEIPSGLTEEEFDDFNDIVGDTISALLKCADKHNIDRNSFMRYFASIFSTMCEISDFEKYEVKDNG